MKNILVVTGGAGFVGSNLIEELIKFKKYTIISLDNYSSGSKRNHIKNSKIKYLKGDTKNISNILKKHKKKIHTIFHFEEFSRIFKSFERIATFFSSNVQGSSELFNFVLENEIKLVYPATSSILRNKV
jgi:UDP-glucose 4-epimerase